MFLFKAGFKLNAKDPCVFTGFIYTYQGHPYHLFAVFCLLLLSMYLGREAMANS